MQRRATTRLASAALVLAVAGGLTACTGGSGEDEAGTKPGDATAAAESAPPGRFRTLPEPCGAVSRDLLGKLLPGAAAAAKEAEEDAGEDAAATPSPLDGEAALTYDTDRRVGCTWQSTTSLGSRQLTVDFQRIVSYDPEVSDDEQAEQLFAARAAKAGVGDATEEARESGAPATGGEVEADASDGADTGVVAQSDGRGGSSTQPSAQPSDGGGDDTPGDAEPGEGETELASPSPKPSLPPRTLDGIGDAAFIDDRLGTAADGRGSHRDITLVFRTSNVLVTVEYSQSIADAHRTPASAELQKHAQNVARHLAEQFSDI